MKDNKLVSVIMSVYNDGDRVQKAIESILNQSYSNFELLITDDCSSDHTLRICNKYSELDNVKVYRNNENIGLTKSLNKLIELTKGDFIARQDSDDISHKMRIEKQIEFMNNNNSCGISGTYAEIFGESEGIRKHSTDTNELKIRSLFSCQFCHPTVIIRKKIIEDQKINISKEKLFYKNILKIGYSEKNFKNSKIQKLKYLYSKILFHTFKISYLILNCQVSPRCTISKAIS